MSLPTKHVIQHNPFSLSTQSLTSLLPDRQDGNQYATGNSYSSEPSLGQRNEDLERQPVAPHSRTSSNNSIYQHGRNDSDERNKHSALTQTQTLQHSFEDLDRFQQQLELKKGVDDDGRPVSASSYNNYSSLSPPSFTSHHCDVSQRSHSSDHFYDADGYYGSLTPPYAECPLVTDDLHLPVPSILHHYFIYDDNDGGDKQNNKTFETMVDQLRPYPFRARAPVGNRLKRKPPPGEQQDHDINAAKRYPSLLDQQREKRHSLGNGQIDRLVHGRKSILEENELTELLSDSHQGPLEPPPSATSASSSSTSALGYSPSLEQQQRLENQNDLLLEDRIHWLTQGYYLIPTSQQNATPSPPGGHDPPPSLLSSSPSSSPLV